MNFVDVASDYRRAVLSVIGPKLLELKFFNCDGIDIAAELLPCKKVEDVFINKGSLLVPISPGVDIPADSFMPSLKYLFLTICSSDISRLLETSRPSFVKLICNCVHFGIPEASSHSWGDLPSLWPNLVSLLISNRNRSISTEGLRQMRSAIPQLKKLNNLALPEELVTLGAEEDEPLVREMEHELRRRYPEFAIRFYPEDTEDFCMY